MSWRMMEVRLMGLVGVVLRRMHGVVAVRKAVKGCNGNHCQQEREIIKDRQGLLNGVLRAQLRALEPIIL